MAELDDHQAVGERLAAQRHAAQALHVRQRSQIRQAEVIHWKSRLTLKLALQLLLLLKPQSPQP